MYSRVLILLAFLAVVSSSNVLLWCPPHEGRTAPQTNYTASPRCYPLQSPEAFMGSNVDYLFPGYPPLSEFFFKASAMPQNARMNSYIQGCVSSLLPGDDRYNEFAHTVKGYFQCDTAPLWKEDSKNNAEAARQTSLKSSLHSSAAPAKNIIACQVAELAEFCFMVDSVVSCVRERVSREVRMSATQQNGTKSNRVERLFLNNQQGTRRNDEMNMTQLSAEAERWSSDSCKQMAEKGQCGSYLVEFRQLARDISRPQGLQRGQYAGCF
eukprot:GHVS01016357.1.p1 GENE.GHVS01016357.1~~GHVS01016357.1.p1  ORF type:complete len:268 (+),score=18.08 GHVS01016357.1:52-855(+)